MPSRKELLKIINHYGLNHQQRKLAEEHFELQETITTHEVKKFSSSGIPITEIVETREHIAEEIADNMFILEQIREYYGIPKTAVKKQINYKYKRQIERMECENNVKTGS